MATLGLLLPNGKDPSIAGLYCDLHVRVASVDQQVPMFIGTEQFHACHREGLAALIVGLAMAVIGGIAFYMAKKEVRRLSFKADHAIAAAKEKVRWAKNRSR